MPVAAITMVYNDPEYLPIWCRYYGGALGKENCYIVDHGSDDGSTLGLTGFNVLRIPRSPKDNAKRTRFISRLSSNLLEWYDAILHSDVDEIIVPDPKSFSGLRDYMENSSDNIANAYGFDIYQGNDERDIDLSVPILEQRKWMRFSSSMCKVVFTRRPIDWAPGFHSADASIFFSDLYLFHLRYFDRKIGLDRLKRTREMAWASETAGSHQRIPDRIFEEWIEQVGRMRKIPSTDLLRDEEPLSAYINLVLSSEKDFTKNSYNLDLHIFPNEVVEIPNRFIGKF